MSRHSWSTLSLLASCAICTLGVGTGCFIDPFARPTTTPAAAALAASDRERPFSSALTEPTKDEVGLVDGKPLSINGFLTLREHLKNRANEAVFWTGTAALAIQNATRAGGREISTQAAIDIARYALGEIGAAEGDTSLKSYFNRPGLPPEPAQVRAEIDRLLAQSVVRRNEFILKSLNQP